MLAVLASLALLTRVGSDLARNATATASSYYDVAPYETAFLPALAVDGDEATAW